jgi:hypothetical protein
MGDKDKNVIEQIVDKINDVVETAATVAADALSQAMEPGPAKSDQQPTSKPTMPLMPVRAPTNRTTAKKAVATKSTVDLSGRITPTYEFPTPDSTAMLVCIPAKKTKERCCGEEIAEDRKETHEEIDQKGSHEIRPRKIHDDCENGSQEETRSPLNGWPE